MASPFLQALVWGGLLLANAGVCAAQEAPDESFALPTFEHADAGHAAPMKQEPVLVKSEVPAAWPALFGTLGAIVNAGAAVSIGAGVVAGYAFGKPNRIDTVKHSDIEQYSGWQIAPTLLFNISKADGSFCNGTRFCGERTQVGVGCWLASTLGRKTRFDELRLSRQLYGQLGPTLSFVDVPAAPLSPGLKWTDVSIQARGGLRLGSAFGGRLIGDTLLLDFSLLAEALVYSTRTRGFLVGATVGIGF